MLLETLLDIVFASLLAAFHIFVFLVIIVWRFKHFHKYLHTSHVCFIFLVLSTFIGVFLPVGGMTFLSDGTAGTKAVVISFLFCPPMLIVAIKYGCFCIYIDGDYAVKKTLFHVTQIDLKNPLTIIKDANVYFKFTVVGIVSKDNESITFTAGYVEGNVALFMSDCKSIHAGN